MGEKKKKDRDSPSMSVAHEAKKNKWEKSHKLCEGSGRTTPTEGGWGGKKKKNANCTVLNSQGKKKGNL